VARSEFGAQQQEDTMTTGLETLLESSADVCGGRIRIRGTRITLNQIVVMYKRGMSPEEIADQYPHLSLAQVFTAIAYFHANREQVEAGLAAEIEESGLLEHELAGRMTGAA
jgi:uncharacterized protein (DUF433 family)